MLDSMFEPSQIPPDFMIDVVGKLFLKFKDRYRNTMFTGGQIDWGRNKVLEWADYFTSKNATLDELRTAYTLCKDEYPTFPPNEAEFLALARQNRYPSADEALAIAVDKPKATRANDDLAHHRRAMAEMRRKAQILNQARQAKGLPPAQILGLTA